MKHILSDGFSKFSNRNVIDCEAESLTCIIDMIKYLEMDVPGKNNGDLKWKLLWDWMIVYYGEEILHYRQEIKKVINEIVTQMNISDWHWQSNSGLAGIKTIAFEYIM